MPANAEPPGCAPHQPETPRSGRPIGEGPGEEEEPTDSGGGAQMVFGVRFSFGFGLFFGFQIVFLLLVVFWGGILFLVALGLVYFWGFL